MHVAVQTQKTDAELSVRVANAETRISALEQKVSERESTPAAAEAAEENVNFEVQQLEKRDAAANEIVPQERPPCSPAGDEQGKPWHPEGAERAEVPHERHVSTVP